MPAQALTVSEVVARARRQLEGDRRPLSLEGEVSGFRRAASGNLYFSLKDRSAELRIIMYRLAADRIRFVPADGLSVLVSGSLTVYEARGDLQLVALHMEPCGRGERNLAFEQLKARLRSEGLFADERKRPLPLLPRRVGIVTSAQGAALGDILTVLRRRQSRLDVLIAPARVQGAGAPTEIAEAIARVAREPRVDVVIAGRGGGSAEDLWAFNDEEVARAIAASPVPVVSAIGHEGDVTLADLVADLRAPTPSAAAELVARSTATITAQVADLARRQRAALSATVARLRLALSELGSHRALVAIEHLPARLGQRLDDLGARLLSSAGRLVARRRQRLAVTTRELGLLDVRVRLARDRARLDALTRGLRQQTARRLEHGRTTLSALVAGLDSLSPLAVLGRGYAIARRPDGHILRDASELVPGDPLDVRLGRGSVRCRVATDTSRAPAGGTE